VRNRKGFRGKFKIISTLTQSHGFRGWGSEGEINTDSVGAKANINIFSSHINSAEPIFFGTAV